MKILVVLGILLAMFILLTLLGKLFAFIEDKLEFAPDALILSVLVPILILQMAVVVATYTAMDKVLSGGVGLVLDAIFAVL